jgi:ActR/RegA family two-component response regulator
MASHRLLLLDDEEPILFALEDYFTACGWEVDTARTRADAEALLAERPYAAVVADLRLTMDSDVDGLDVLGTVRRRNPDTRTVLLTAYGTHATELRSHTGDVDAILQKPQPLAEVARVLERLLGSRPDP